MSFVRPGLIQINISTLKIGRKGQQHILGNTIAKQTTEQMTGRTQEAITSYFAWLQNAMLAPPWGDTDLNKKLISYATETVTAPCAFAQKLTQAKNLEDVIKIQTKFVKTQTDIASTLGSRGSPC